jgi:hypothetical protein
MKISTSSISKLVTCATLLLTLGSCSGGGSGEASTTAPPPPAAAPATMTVNSPAQGAANLPPGPVLVTFDIQNSPVPLSTTKPRMHFYVDDDPVVYKFYDGPGITETGSTSGVRHQGVHTTSCIGSLTVRFNLMPWHPGLTRSSSFSWIKPTSPYPSRHRP